MFDEKAMSKLNDIRQHYRDTIPEEKRKQMLELIKDPVKYAVLKAAYELDFKEVSKDGKSDFEKIYIEARKFMPDESLDILDFFYAMEYLKKEQLLDFEYC